MVWGVSIFWSADSLCSSYNGSGSLTTEPNNTESWQPALPLKPFGAPQLSLAFPDTDVISSGTQGLRNAKLHWRSKDLKMYECCLVRLWVLASWWIWRDGQRSKAAGKVKEGVLAQVTAGQDNQGKLMSLAAREAHRGAKRSCCHFGYREGAVSRRG